ncbi:hypothetical protein TNCV_23561 [Trichonephila clavipes]|nr:hypothetical protein TNCV_23561 [Trichonephila clavipes]
MYELSSSGRAVKSVSCSKSLRNAAIVEPSTELLEERPRGHGHDLEAGLSGVPTLVLLKTCRVEEYKTYVAVLSHHIGVEGELRVRSDNGRLRHNRHVFVNIRGSSPIAVVLLYGV